MSAESTEDTPYELVAGTNVPVKAWTRGVPFEEGAKAQLRYAAMMPFIHSHIAVMPDVHVGIGATVGSVIPTRGAIIPAAVGVDIGCGMMAVRTTLTSNALSDNAQKLFEAIAEAVPHGGGREEQGNWPNVPKSVRDLYGTVLHPRLRKIIEKHGRVSARSPESQLGTLGGGNHFIEVCIDEADQVWFMLHSGSRGIGNRIGNYFIERAKYDMQKLDRRVPQADLAYFEEGSDNFTDYVEAVSWAQDYARINREVMMEHVVSAVKKETRGFKLTEEAVNCHHNYVEKEHHFGADVYVTRKGAVSAQNGELGIIPGSMGTRSYIVRGKGNPESFHSCSHGAGRVMPRGAAKRTITLEDHRKDTEGVACRKDRDVIDESPRAYKDIDMVMKAQSDLVDIVHTLKQVVCVKG